jgi:hypothetical protein
VKRIVFGLAVIGAALVAAQVATSAPSRVHVSGTYTVTDFGALSCAPNGSPFVLRCTTTRFVSQYSGDLTGTSVANFEQIIDCKNSRTHGQGTETFTGSIAGVGSGTLTWESISTLPSTAEPSPSPTSREGATSPPAPAISPG